MSHKDLEGDHIIWLIQDIQVLILVYKRVFIFDSFKEVVVCVESYTLHCDCRVVDI